METDQTTLYERIADRILAQIRCGTFRSGEKIPSIRRLSREMGVSINTVKEAYWLLEDGRFIECKPQSGYFVRKPDSRIPDLARAQRGEPMVKDVTVASACTNVLKNVLDNGYVPLGIALSDPTHLPLEKMHRLYVSDTNRRLAETFVYPQTDGIPELRVEIAKRLFSDGVSVSPDRIIVTNGCTEAVYLALSATCSPGDAIAVESPFYFSFNLILRGMGLKVIEIPNSPTTGINLDVLEFALKRHGIKACLVNHNFNNPAGSLMPEENKKKLVGLLLEYGVPLIEDDIYGDISYLPGRPKPCKAFDETDGVILCSSFTKTLASGLRLGWIVPGKWYERALEIKAMLSIAAPSPSQFYALSFLQSGGYDRHIRQFRRTIHRQMSEIRAAVIRHFPAETKVSLPNGGLVLWLELPHGVDSMEMYRLALDEGITVAPGALFSFDDRYRNYARLNVGYWSPEIEIAVATLGSIAGDLARG